MPLDPVKLLVVDDIPQNLTAVEAVLRRPDYEIVTVSSGEDALRFLLRSDCALILMDVQMPTMDGIETARLIRSNERTRPIPIVLMTAKSREEQSVARGYEIGAADYILKPIDPAILKAKVAAFVELFRAKQQVVRHTAALRERDRTDRQRAIAELEQKSQRREQQAQERYRRLLDGITHAIVWTVDSSTLACTYVSPSAEQILGYPQGDWQRSPTFWQDIVPRHERERVVEALASLTSAGAGARVRHGFMAADGRVARFQTDFSLLEPEEGAGAAVRGFSVDVSDAIRAEETLSFLDHASSDLASSLEIESAVAAAARVAVPFICDGAVVEVWGHKGRAEPVVSVAHADPACAEALRELASLPELRASGEGTGVEVVDVAARLRHPAGDAPAGPLAPVSMVAIPLVARGGAIGSLRLFREKGRPIFGEHGIRLAKELGRREAQAIDNALLYREARDAIRSRDEFLSIASHELRTPLTPIRLQTEAMDRRVKAQIPAGPVQDEMLRRLGICATQVERMTRLITNLLDVSRLRAGRFELQLVQCDLREVVQDVASRFADELSRAGRSIELGLNGSVVGRWDRTRLDQVLTNLVSNAIRYGGDKPIAIACSHETDRAVLTVTDRGPGIPEDDLGRIFERFETGPASRSLGGLGLGLFIARHIVQAHGGRIDVSSTIGEGSTFKVELPLEPRPLAEGRGCATHGEGS